MFLFFELKFFILVLKSNLFSLSYIHRYNIYDKVLIEETAYVSNMSYDSDLKANRY